MAVLAEDNARVLCWLISGIRTLTKPYGQDGRRSAHRAVARGELQPQWGAEGGQNSGDAGYVTNGD